MDLQRLGVGDIGVRKRSESLHLHSQRASTKHAHKHLGKDRPAHERAIPLGVAMPLDDDKGDEERKIESLLFGKPSVARQ